MPVGTQQLHRRDGQGGVMELETHPAAAVSRRHLLLGALGGAAAVLTGCTTGASVPPAASASPVAPGPSGSTGATTKTLAPRPGGATPTARPAPAALTTGVSTRAWVPGPDEYAPAVKARAVAVVEALAAWSAGHGGTSAAARRLAALGVDPALAATAGPLVSDDTVSAVQVLDAQYAGILDTAADVMVMAQWWRRDPGGPLRSGGTTVQVLLEAASPQWRVTGLVPAAPGAATGALHGPAAAALAEPRLRLPAAARADIATGTISAQVATALVALARDHVVDVSVVRSGHPYHVFGTGRVSDHPRGRAVDIWAVDGAAVVDPANRAATEQVMRFGIALGAWQVGGPVQLAGPQYFSDHTHHDHVHWGFLA